jgi:hypothetical protein
LSKLSNIYPKYDPNIGFFDKLLNEIKRLNIFECRLEVNDVNEYCDTLMDMKVNIYYKGVKHEKLFHLTEKIHKTSNHSLVEHLKIIDEKSYIFSIGFDWIDYSKLNRTENQLKNKENYFPTINNLKQRDFVKITNSTEYYFKFFFNIEKDFEAEHNFLSIESNQQKELIVIKKQFQFLEYPYKSNCNNWVIQKKNLISRLSWCMKKRLSHNKNFGVMTSIVWKVFNLL